MFDFIKKKKGKKESTSVEKVTDFVMQLQVSIGQTEIFDFIKRKVDEILVLSDVSMIVENSCFSISCDFFRFKVKVDPNFESLKTVQVSEVLFFQTGIKQTIKEVKFDGPYVSMHDIVIKDKKIQKSVERVDKIYRNEDIIYQSSYNRKSGFKDGKNFSEDESKTYYINGDNIICKITSMNCVGNDEVKKETVRYEKSALPILSDLEDRVIFVDPPGQPIDENTFKELLDEYRNSLGLYMGAIADMNSLH